MTTVAANRHMMAADSRVVDDDTGIHYTGQKIYTIGHAFIGVAGDNVSIELFLAWLRAGHPEKKPEFSNDNEDQSLRALVLDASGLYLYDESCVAQPLDRIAIGSGGAAALGAMMAGKNPAEAVEIACDIDKNTGRPVVVVTLDDLPRAPQRKGRRV
jgi:ATP-dependent protease HslVU (ClpYQ) peptidase subunit